jgi:GST-like protein
MLDRSTAPPTKLFESGSILFYLAEKFGAFLPTEGHKRAATMNWLMWQMGSAPFVGGGFGHFFAYAPFKIEYAINRYTMETKRQLHVLDTHLADNEYMIGDEYTIADIAIWPWYGAMMRTAYGAQEFLSVHEYKHLNRWVELIACRPAVKRGQMVNRMSGPPNQQVPERHSAADIDNVLNG